MEFDRSSFTSPDEGDSIFPLSPFFSRLVRYAHKNPPRLAIRDVNLGIERSYLELMSDALALKNRLRRSLQQATIRDLRVGKEVYIGLLAAGGYEYAVGFVAIVALGAAVVPMSEHLVRPYGLPGSELTCMYYPALLLPVHEASYFVLKARCVAILASDAGLKPGESLVQYIRTKPEAVDIPCIPITPSSQSFFTLASEDIRLSTDRYLDDNGAGVVIFTSGTTGPPKGAVMKRAYLHDCSQEIIDQFKITESDVILHVLPVHHATGVGINFLPYIFAGACVEFRSGSVDIAWLWERWKCGRLTVFSGVPTIYMRMMRYYEHRLACLPANKVRNYVDGARRFRILLCGTSALPEPVSRFWSDILGHENGVKRRILTRYGSTEAGAIFRTPLECEDVPENSVGHLAPGVTVKLSNGDEGEILVKSPWMFAKYLYDPAATAAAHDENGYLRSGDIAKRQGKNYFILGRSSIDILKSGGYKISALDVEREILSLPYINEVMVVGVADEEYGQRIAALVTLRDDQTMYRCGGNGGRGKDLSIYDLRHDLRSRLAGYKMPTILKMLEEDLPKGPTGKVMKKALGPRYFPKTYRNDPTVQVWEKQTKQSIQNLAKL